jgi:hypothetical protein
MGAKMKKIDRWTKKLNDPPIEGIHGWIYGRANYLKSEGLSQNEAVEIIKLKVKKSRLRRPLQPNEIQNSASNAFNGSDKLYKKPNVKLLRQKPKDFKSQWPNQMPLPKIKKNNDLIEEIFENYGLWEIDDILKESELLTTELPTSKILSHLYLPEELICIGKISNFKVLSLKGWAQMKDPFSEQIVPNPNRVLSAYTKNGTLSSHCRAATGVRKYLIVEFDDEKLEKAQQGALVKFLEVKAGGELKMIVDSGRKSLHAWFKASTAESLNWKFMLIASSIGADPRMWLPEQFARTPNAMRGNGNIQTCLYLKGNKL